MSTNRNFTNGDDSFVLFEKGTAANIPPNFGNGSEYTDGKIYFDTDNSKLYIDADYKQGTAMRQKRHLIAGNSIVDIGEADNNGNAPITKLDGTSGNVKLGYTAGNGITINNHQISANQANADKTDANKPNKVWKTDNNGVPGWRDDTNTWKRNTQDQEGYVTAPKDTNGNYLTNKVWKTNGSGVPGWRDDSNTAYTAGTGISISNNQISCTVWKPNTVNQDGYVTSGSNHANKVWKTDGDGNPNWRDVANVLKNKFYTTSENLLIPAPITTADTSDSATATAERNKKRYQVLNALGKWVGLNDTDTITCRMFYDEMHIGNDSSNQNDIYGQQFTILYPGDLVSHNYTSDITNMNHPQISFVSYHINSNGGLINQSSTTVDGITYVHWKCGLPRHFSFINGITGGGIAAWTQNVDARIGHTRPLDVGFRFDSDPRTETVFEPINTIYLDIYIDQGTTPFTQTTNIVLDISFIIIGVHTGNFSDNLRN